MSLDVSLVVKADTGNKDTEDIYVFDSKITHNLNTMANQAGIYYHCWRPEELGISKAHEIIQPLKDGLDKLKNDPEYFKQFNAKNGWGIYDDFVPWVEEYFNACIKYPNATIETSI